MTTRIWTQPVRGALYEALVTQFGPYATWENATIPSNKRRAAYRSFCMNFARVIGCKSWAAVNQQIRFATHPTKALDKANLRHNAVLNLAAAYEAGFITL